MTTREWFRVMRRADWERSPGDLLDLVDTVIPRGLMDERNVELPAPVTEPGVYVFWRLYQPMRDEERRAHKLARLLQHPIVTKS